MHLNVFSMMVINHHVISWIYFVNNYYRVLTVRMLSGLIQRKYILIIKI